MGHAELDSASHYDEGEYDEILNHVQDDDRGIRTPEPINVVPGERA